MAWWSKSVMENGVEVTYSNNCELYHMDTTTGEYDAKIDVYPSHVESYASRDSYWDEHDHYHMDRYGTETEVHGMEVKSWRDTCRS